MLLFKMEDLNSTYFIQTENLLCKNLAPPPDTPTPAWLVAPSDPAVNQETEPQLLKHSTISEPVQHINTPKEWKHTFFISR